MVDGSVVVYKLKHVLLPVRIAELRSMRVHAYVQLYRDPVGLFAHAPWIGLQVWAV